jgi:hypothetical protein
MPERIHNMDEPVEVNEHGAAQSALKRVPRLVPAEAILRLAEVVGFGAAKYAENNWRKIPYEDHINHALEHLFLLMNDDKSDDHLGHALCRLAFAVATEKEYSFKEFRPLADKAPKSLTRLMAEASAEYVLETSKVIGKAEALKFAKQHEKKFFKSGSSPLVRKRVVKKGTKRG